jgi:hypothetical protein
VIGITGRTIKGGERPLGVNQPPFSNGRLSIWAAPIDYGMSVQSQVFVVGL